MNFSLFASAVLKFLCGAVPVGVLIFVPAGTVDFGGGRLLMGVLFR